MIMNTRIIGKDLETLLCVLLIRTLVSHQLCPFWDGEDLVRADVFPRTRADKAAQIGTGMYMYS